MPDDDPGGVGRRTPLDFPAPAGIDFVPKSRCQDKEDTNVTIYHGTDSKIYDVVREGALLGRRWRCVSGTLRVTAEYRGEGE